MGYIRFTNKSLAPINIVLVKQALISTPVSWERYMNVAPGDTVSLDVGNNKLLQCRQFRVFVWGGGSPGLEISEDQLRGYFMVRQGTSWLITAATGGAHKIFAGFAEQAYAEVVQHFVLDHIMSEIITPHLFDKAIEHTVKKVLKAGVKKAMGPLIPSSWGVCSTFFMAALDGNERYVYGGPEIEDGTLVQGEKLWIGTHDNGFDPVAELAKITEDKDTVMRDAAIIAGSALLIGASLPLSAVASGAYYFWRKNKKT